MVTIFDNFKALLGSELDAGGTWAFDTTIPIRVYITAQPASVGMNREYRVEVSDTAAGEQVLIRVAMLSTKPVPDERPQGPVIDHIEALRDG